MSNKVVVYFSISGVTERVAKKMAKEIGADVYVIQPKEEYTEADLNSMDQNSRSSLEMKDRNSRPQLANMDFNINQYDEIHIGFPIWWGVAPHAVNSFLESYEF